MLQKLKFNDLENIFVVSDLHYGHDRDFIWGKRGFSSVEESNETLVNEWNRRVNFENDVFHLGDLIFKSDEARFWKLINRLNFKTLYLLPGNHVSSLKQAYLRALAHHFPEIAKRNLEIYPLEVGELNGGRKIVFLPNLVEVLVKNYFFILSHYSLAAHNGQGHGSYHLCGHSHGNCSLTNKDTGQGRRLDVGIESFGGPISLKFVVDFLKDREYNCLDHH